MTSVLEAAQSGDEVATLEALRDKLAAMLDEAPATVAANISGQIVKVLERLSDLTPSGKVTLSDALAERRVARAASTEPAVAAGGKAKRAG